MGCITSKKAAVSPDTGSPAQVKKTKESATFDASSLKAEPPMSDANDFSVKDGGKGRASVATVDFGGRDRSLSTPVTRNTAAEVPISADDIVMGDSGSNKLKAKLPPQVEDERTVRVFFCSSFRDLPDERSLLFDTVLPKIRDECTARGLSFVPIDFRWGVDNQIAYNNEVLRMSLQAVEFADYFVCAMGSLYGWVPDAKNPASYGPNIEMLYPWAADYKNSSIVELECRLAAMVEKATSHRSFFYFKDPSMDANDKVLRLKRDIGSRHKAFKYLTPEQFAAKFEAEFINSLRDDFPNQIPSSDEFEKKSHKIYARSQLSINHGRQDLIASVEKQIAPTSSLTMMSHSPTVIVGQPGSGKSAFVASLWRKMEMTYSDKCFCWAHFVGCSEDSYHLDRLLARAKTDIGGMPLLKKQESKADVSGLDVDRVSIHSLDSLFKKIAAKQSTGCVIFIDGVNKLRSLDPSLNPFDLSWIPSTLPPRVHVVISTVAGHETHKVCSQRNWPMHEIPKLENADREKILLDHLGGISKRFTSAQINTIVQRAEPEMPLYLGAISKEITRVIDAGTIDEKILPLINTTNLQQLYLQIMSRLEKDYGATMVEKCLSALQLSRIGLSEMEIQEYSLDGNADNRNIDWFGLFFNIKHFLISRKKRLCLYHDSIAEAIQSRYLFSQDHTLNGCKALAKFLQGKYPIEQSPPSEIYAEITYLLHEGECWDDLYQYITLPEVAKALLSEKYGFEFAHYWKSLKSNGRDDVSPYATIAQADNEVCKCLASYYCDNGNLAKAQELLEKILTATAGEDPSSAWLLTKLCDICKERKMFKQAVEYANQAVSKCEALGGSESKELGNMLHKVADLHEQAGNYQKALDYYAQSQVIDEKLYGEDNLVNAATMTCLGVLYERIGDPYDALDKYKKALGILEKVKGYESPDVAVVLTHLAGASLKTGKWIQAAEFANRALDICKGAFGATHPSTVACSANLAFVLLQLGKVEDAQQISEQVLSSARKSEESGMDLASILIVAAQVNAQVGKFDDAISHAAEALQLRQKKSPDNKLLIGETYNQLGLFCHKQGDLEKAMESYATAITMIEESTSTCDPALVPVLMNLSHLLCTIECYEEANMALQRVEEIRKSCGEDDHADLTTVELGKGYIKRQQSDYEQSLAHYDKELNLRMEYFGPRSIEVAKVLVNMAVLHVQQGRSDDALQAASQSIEICETLYGKENGMSGFFYINQALVQSSAGKAEAVDTLGAGVGLLSKLYGSNHPHTECVRSILS
eukprot:TRINITY_DN2971_c0_g1_i1.p1 TRINITY_DN2971_c0_g1~~TRINITY_DN2971_c0_g1_i1.p1  ORF type:complete len:1270 (-),score=282.42 TRINITY_DN2971_c0_g1_i1:437-4246(-)